jgi:hypothetical protein
MGIDAEEMANQLAHDSASHTLTAAKPAVGTSAKVARGKIRDWTRREHEKHWQTIHEPNAS